MARPPAFPPLPERRDDIPLVYIVVGEPSGDQLASHMIRALKHETGGKIAFRGLAGERMQAEGLTSVFPIGELALMGAEVVPHLRHLLRRIQMVADDILMVKPDVVVMVDAQSFSARVGKKVAGNAIPLVQYVAPTVWAWKPGRAKKISAYLDHLLTLFPFEAPYFEKHGLKTTFVGHPAAEGERRPTTAGPSYRATHSIDPAAPMLCVLPGSRRGEVKRHLPIFRDVVARLVQEMPDLICALPTVPNVAELVRDGSKDWPCPLILSELPSEKYDVFAAADVALAVSGTVTVETSFARLPTVVAYRAPPVTAAIARLVILTKYASGTNLVLDRPVLPEFIQNRCRPDLLSAAVAALFTSPDARQAQLDGIDAANQLMQVGDHNPSLIAARAVLKEIAQGTDEQ